MKDNPNVLIYEFKIDTHTIALMYATYRTSNIFVNTQVCASRYQKLVIVKRILKVKSESPHVTQRSAISQSSAFDTNEGQQRAPIKQSEVKSASIPLHRSFVLSSSVKDGDIQRHPLPIIKCQSTPESANKSIELNRVESNKIDRKIPSVKGVELGFAMDSSDEGCLSTKCMFHVFYDHYVRIIDAVFYDLIHCQSHLKPLERDIRGDNCIVPVSQKTVRRTLFGIILPGNSAKLMENHLTNYKSNDPNFETTKRVQSAYYLVLPSYSEYLLSTMFIQVLTANNDTSSVQFTYVGNVLNSSVQNNQNIVAITQRILGYTCDYIYCWMQEGPQ
ncbi:hypothetical protein WN51_01278 [Melipona quadrifasciata]|uniref:Uncharacterized protein n=1 Tax=Melipona quadrifasciata TaxID=166423 RepID=A0A0M8ZZD3_9HYME|nr:hypothetical protein WN51_01278 [Melipona quadrifasciata]